MDNTIEHETVLSLMQEFLVWVHFISGIPSEIFPVDAHGDIIEIKNKKIIDVEAYAEGVLEIRALDEKEIDHYYLYYKNNNEIIEILPEDSKIFECQNDFFEPENYYEKREVH